MHIENVMLKYLQSDDFGASGTVTIHAKKFDKEDLTQWEKVGFNILVLSEGNVVLGLFKYFQFYPVHIFIDLNLDSNLYFYHPGQRW